ncbi:hypothetical protein STEG23_018157, partial [Scotinomys teguina]
TPRSCLCITAWKCPYEDQLRHNILSTSFIFCTTSLQEEVLQGGLWKLWDQAQYNGSTASPPLLPPCVLLISPGSLLFSEGKWKSSRSGGQQRWEVSDSLMMMCDSVFFTLPASRITG